MDFFSNFQFIDQYAKELLQPRPCHYMNQQIWKHLLDKQKYSYQNVQLNLKQKESKQIKRKINLSLIKHKSLQMSSQKTTKQKFPCIVYLHGLSSFSIEGNFLIDYLDLIQNCSLCLYDLRGHGKDTAQTITFGMKQSQQLLQILLKLQQTGITNFILWGRSMGASTILKMVQDYNSNQAQKNILQIKKINISCLVIDSPFISFEKVAIQMISQQIKLPQLFSRIVFGYLLKGIKNCYKFDMQIDVLQKCKQIHLPTLVLYSQNDKIISPNHAKEIYQKLSKEKQLINIQISHNEIRPHHIIMKAIQMINKSLKSQSQKNQKYQRRSRSRSRSISLTKNRKTSISIGRNQKNQKVQRKQRKSGLSITKDNRIFTQKNQQYLKTEEIQIQQKKLRVFGSQIIQTKSKDNKQQKRQITLINCHKSQEKAKPLGVQTYIYKKQTIMTKPQENKEEKKNIQHQHQPINLMNISKFPTRLSDRYQKLENQFKVISFPSQNDNLSQKTIFNQAQAFAQINKNELKQQRNRNMKQLQTFKERKFRQAYKFDNVKSCIVYDKFQKYQQHQKQNDNLNVLYKANQRQKPIKIKIFSDSTNKYKNSEQQQFLIEKKLNGNKNSNKQSQDNVKSMIILQNKIEETIKKKVNQSFKNNMNISRNRGYYVCNLTNTKYL